MAPFPSGPTGVNIGLTQTSDTGPLDGFTSVKNPTLGFLYVDFSANAPVEIYRDGVLVDTAQTGSDGIGYFTSDMLSDGTYSFTARDPNSSIPSNLTPATVTIDTVAPQLVNTSFTGSQIILTFSEKLDDRFETTTSPFQVTADGQPIENEVIVSGREVILNFRPIDAGSGVTVSYQGPSVEDGSITAQDRAGNDVGTFGAVPVADVTNDTTVPVFESASVTGDLLTLTYDSFLRQSLGPDVSNFTVIVNDERVSLRTADVIGDKVVLRLARTIEEGAVVNISYADGDSLDQYAIQDQASNPGASLTAQAVLNNNNVAPTVAVNIVDATLSSTDLTSNVTFAFSEAVLGFDRNDVTAVGGTISAVTVSATSPLLYTATFTADPRFIGTGSVSIGVDYTDAAGNGGTAGSDTVAIYTGSTAGSDNLIGTIAADTIVGLAGDDTVHGGGGNDILYGGGGFIDTMDSADQLYGDAGSDTIYGNAGNDTIYGGSMETDPADAADTIYGGLGNDVVFGNGGNDVLYGNTGSDYVNGGIGADTIYGGNGETDTTDSADTLYGNAGSDVIYGNAGNDIIYGGAGVTDPTDAADTIHGGLGDDLVYGNGGDDSVYGEDGNDVLIGGAGADTLYGGTGQNVLTGSIGADRFVHSAAANDIVTDFSFADGDRLDTGGVAYTLTSTSDGSVELMFADGGTIVLQGVTQTEFQSAFVA